MNNTIIQNIKNVIVIIILATVVFCGTALIMSRSASAAPDCTMLTGDDKSKCQACAGAGGETYTAAGKCSDSSGPAAEDQVGGLVKDVINIFSAVIGIVCVIMIMVGGFKYVTSTGDSNNIQSAKNTILYAIVGLVVVALAQIIVMFVINKTNSATSSSSSTAASP